MRGCRISAITKTPGATPFPIAVGAALSIKHQKKNAVAVCFFGDGANNEGSFHESLNMASIWKLPVVFVCENNQYGMSTSIERSTSVKNIADRSVSYSMPGITVDGNSFSDVASASVEAVARAKSGEGPTLIECLTYRTRGHSRSDRNRYRTKEEIDAWAARDPIPRFEGELLNFGILNETMIAEVREAAEREIQSALEFAKSSPDPDPLQVANFVYSS